jgi:hypothetical protein
MDASADEKKRNAMNATRSMKWGFSAAMVTFVTIAAMPGCELLVQFDRNLIDGGGGGMDGTVTPMVDAPSTPDAADGQIEAAGDDGGNGDAPVEASGDGAAEATAEAGGEGGADGGADAPMEAAADGAADGPGEVGSDGAADAPAEAADGGADVADSGPADASDGG